MALADNASVKNELQTALSDLSSLGRVSHRLAMIDNSSKLQSVLDKLLARLLERFGANYQKQATVSGEGDRMLTDTLKKIHQKLVETLSHAMKRARDDRDVKLNCDSILTLMLEPIDKEGGIPKALPTVNPFTLNLSLAFLALGIPRCSETELKLLLPDLIILHGFYASRAIDNSSVTSRSHWHQFSHLLLTSLDLIMEYHEREQEKASKKLKLSNSTTTATPSRLLSTITASDKSSDSEFNDNSNKTYMDEIYRVLTKDLVAAAALYDLMLDGLLYQSTTGGVPPPGCSQAGQERLQSNKPWMAEMAPPARLSLCKARLLDWIAPSLQTCLFPTDEARTCTLLLAASGDGGSQVSHQAGLYLKQYLELKQERKDTSTAHNFLDLIIELLILCVGSNNALLALSGSTLPSLGLDHFQSAQRSMPFRRRMVSDSTFAVMMTQVDKAFANEPHLFDEEPDQFKIMHQVGTLTILASSKMLVKLRTSTGLTALRGKPYVSAARAMNSLVVRFLSTLEGGKKDQNFDENSLNQIGSLLAKALSLTFTSLSNTVIGSSSSVNSVTSNEGNLSIRDALYGIICELSRSASLVSGPYSWLFAMGKDQDLSLPSKIDTATLLFRCLAKEEQSLLPRTTAALDAVLAAYCRAISKKNHPQMPSPNMNPWITAESEIMPMTNDEDSVSQAKLAKSLLPLLWGASQYAQSKPSRLAAARWSSELLTQLDLTNACHLLCFLSGDKDVTVVSIAMQGLCLGDKTQSSQQILGDHESEKEDGAETMTELGNFSRLTSLLFSATSQERPRFWEFRPKAKASSIAYLLKCLMNDFYGCEDEALYSYMDATTKSLVEVSNFAKGYIELLDTCATSLAACVSTSLFARKLLFGSEAKHLSLGLQDMEELTLNVPSSCARRALADACGSIYGDMSLWTDDEWLSSIVRAMELSLNSLEASAGGRPGSVHGAAFLGGTCVKQYRLNSKFATSESGWKLACQILDALGRGTTVSDDIVGKGFTDALSVTLSYRKGSGADAPRLDARLQEGATSALSGLASALRKYSSDEYTDVSRTSKVAHSMGVCLEATIPYNDENKNENDRLHTVRLQCIESLLALLGSAAYRKDEEIALGAGEALAAYAWVPKGLKYSSESNEWPNEMDTDFALTLPPHQQVVYTVLRGSKLTSNPLKRTAHAPVLLALVARAASRVNHDAAYAKTGLVQELSRRLNELQSSFISLLSDPKSKKMCRESCCLGLAACHSLAKLSDTGNEINEKLLRAFGQTTNYGISVMQETQEQANRRRTEEGRLNNQGGAEPTDEEMGVQPEVGGSAGMSEAALGAYREMAAAAVSLGRPGVLYALFMLSVTHSAWFSKGGRERYGPSALLGENSIIGSRTNTAELRVALRPHLGKIIPRLLRASHDPNKQTREQIKNLWDGLTGGGAEARGLITQHLLSIVDSLITDTTHKLWRARVGATGALAQVIVGRSWSELGGGGPVLDDDDILSNSSTLTAGIRLLKLWNISMRSLDDIRSAVRESGETLARGVRSLTLTTDDVQNEAVDKSMHSRDSSAVAATSLRWLIMHGLNQPCPEAIGVCVSCLVGVITVVKPSILQPLIPDLLRSLLLAMSSLEPAALSYLQVRAAGQGGTAADSSYGSLERLRLQVAQAGPLAEAVTKLLDMVPCVDLDVQRAVIPQLNSALHQSAGFTTRAAVADACSTLCNTCPNAFKFTGSTSTNPSVGLLRGFFHGAEREAGAAARNKMAHAFGGLAALCPGSSVRALALRACNNYNSATGANHDPAIRLSAAIALRSIAVRAQNQFSNGGNNDIWCKRVLPVSYLGMRDSDSKVAQLWKEVWEDGGSAANLAGAIDDIGNLLEEKLLVYLVKECNKALADVSWSRRVSGAAALKELADIQILAPQSNYKNRDIQRKDSKRFERRSISSQLALNSLVKLLSATRLWSGKGEVAKATVQIAANWSASTGSESVSDSDDEKSLKQPVHMSYQGQNHDLFIGDDWFCKDHVDDLDPVSTDQQGRGNVSLQDCNVESDSADVSDMEMLSTDLISLMHPVSFVGLCRLLVVQAFPTARAVLPVADEEVLPYRAVILQSLTNLLKNSTGSTEINILKRIVFDTISEKLLAVFNESSILEGTFIEPPLFVARTLDCYAECIWERAGSEHDGFDILNLSKILLQCLEQPAWTVRESATLCCSALVMKGHRQQLSHYETVSLMVSGISRALKDRKFWRVRFAGMKLLHSLVDKVAHNTEISISLVDQDKGTRERQELLESMLPHKEKMLQLVQKSLSDPEAKVTALASDVVKAMAWWP